MGHPPTPPPSWEAIARRKPGEPAPSVIHCSPMPGRTILPKRATRHDARGACCGLQARRRRSRSPRKGTARPSRRRRPSRSPPTIRPSSTGGTPCSSGTARDHDAKIGVSVSRISPSKSNTIALIMRLRASASKLSAGSSGLTRDNPPSAATICPVTQSSRDSSTMTSATSAALPSRPSGAGGTPARGSRAAVRVAANIGVSVAPGATALTRMPSGPSSRAI